MRILLIMDPGIPVPPPLYGGIERLVFSYAEEYGRNGYEVTLLAGPESHISGKTYTFGQNGLSKGIVQRTLEILYVWRFLLKHQHDFDLVHSFGRLIYLLPVLNKPVKKIMTYQRPVSAKGIKWINTLPHANLQFTACSNYCVSTGNVAGKWTTVYNAIDFSKYQLNEYYSDDLPLIFLGRLDKVKGLQHAVQAALKSGNRLLIGGNIPHTPDNYAYFKEHLEPLFDGEQIVYLGPLNDEQKNYHLGRAKALLFPIEWDEPFGIVMIEAMACGTPVIAFNRGAVPEVIENGKNGFIVSSVEEMIKCIHVIGNIDREACRKFASERFDTPIVAKQYLNLAGI